MEIEIAKQELSLGLQRIQGIISSKNIDRIFSFCLIETIGDSGIKINATNKHQTIIGKYDAAVKTEGKVCVEAKILFDIVKVLDDGVVELMLVNEKLEIKCNKSSFHLPTKNPNSFTTLPNFSNEEVEELLTIKSETLTQYINSVNFAVFPTASKPLDNMFFTYDPENNNLLTFVASNGQAFSEIDFHPEPERLKTNKGFEFLLPKPSLKELLLLLGSCDPQDITIKKAGNHLLFIFNRMELAIIPTNSPYVNFRKAYPEGNDVEVSIDRQDFINSVRKVSQVLEQTSVMIKLYFTAGSLKFEAVNNLESGGDAEDIIDIKYEERDITIALNNVFLLETLSHFVSDTVTIKIKDSKTPVIFSDDKRAEYLGILNTMTIVDDEEDLEDDYEEEPDDDSPY
ncbi:MAG: DNA polymerase III subunit beta [Nitrospinae bacterium]|nr:DNA polymerase III subunit beta [Nitrospinota bacterium]